MLSRDMGLSGSVFNYLPHIHIKKSIFPTSGRIVLHGVQGKGKKIRNHSERLFHHSSRSGCLKYVSWTNRKYKNKGWFKIAYLHLAIGNYVFQPEKTLGKLLGEFSFGSGNRWARVLLRHCLQSQKLLNSAAAKASYNTLCSSLCGQSQAEV